MKQYHNRRMLFFSFSQKISLISCTSCYFSWLLLKLKYLTTDADYIHINTLVRHSMHRPFLIRKWSFSSSKFSKFSLACILRRKRHGFGPCVTTSVIWVWYNARNSMWCDSKRKTQSVNSLWRRLHGRAIRHTLSFDIEHQKFIHSEISR